MSARLGWGRLRELLEIVAELRGIDEPLTSAEGLRQAIELLLKLAELLGLDAAFSEKLRAILADEAVFRIVLALIQYALGRVGWAKEDGEFFAATADGELAVMAADFSLHLPTAVELIRLVRGLRGE